VVNDTARFTFVGAGLLQNATPLLTGVYWIEVKACDPYNNNVTAVISVMVDDGSVPTWDQVPSAQTVEFGAQFRLDLNASDPSGISYYWINDTARFSIYPNGTVVSTVSLSVGTYWLEVRAYDPYDLYITATINITVDDTTAPNWVETPTGQICEFGTSFRYDVNATDLSGISDYWVNDTAHFSIDGQGILTNATMLSLGVYRLQIRALDQYDNTLSVNIIVAVVDTTPPIWSATATDLEYVNGTTGHTLSWTVFDLNPGTAQVFRNGTAVNILWQTNSQVMSVDVDGLGVGVYNYTILVIDGAGNRLTDTVWVRVTAATTTITAIPNIIDFIMTMLTNVYVLAGIAAIAIVAAAARKRKKGGKTYEVRDLGAKFGSKK
jgi:hypothetical protein